MRRLFSLLCLTCAPLVVNAQNLVCIGESQPQTAELLKLFKTVSLPYTYLPTTISYGKNGEEPSEYARSNRFTKQFKAPLQQISSVYQWQEQSKPEAQPLNSFQKNLATQMGSIDGYFLLPLVKFATPQGKTAIVMRALPENSESTEKTWVAVLCADGKVVRVSNIEPGTERADIPNYTYTVKSVINQNMTVKYWQNRMKDGAEGGEKGKPYWQGKLDLLQ